MNDFERSLARLQPDAAGLNADAMLFAAGYAVGRRRLWWSLVLSGLLGVLSIGLAVWALAEGSKRPSVAPPRPEVVVPSPAGTPSPEPSPDGYLHLRRLAEQDPNHWLAPAPTAGIASPVGPEPMILRSGLRNGVIDS
jgi:hypothetical protein